MNKSSLSGALLAFAFVSGVWLHNQPAVSAEQSSSADAPITELAENHTLTPDVRAYYLLSYARNYMDNQLVDTKHWSGCLKEAPSWAPQHLADAVSLWADRLSINSQESNKIKTDAQHAALAAKAMKQAIKALAETSDQPSKMTMYFIAAKMYDQLGKKNESATCQSVIDDALKTCEDNSQVSEAQLTMAASVLDSMSSNVIYVAIPDRNLLAALTAIPSFTPLQFEQCEKLKLRAVKILDRLDAKSEARWKGHRDLYLWYLELGKPVAAARQKQIIVELGGLKNDALLYQTVTKSLSGLDATIDRKGKVVRKFSATNSPPYRARYETFKSSGANGKTPYTLDTKTNKKIYFPKYVSPANAAWVSDSSLVFIEIKENDTASHRGLFDAKTEKLLKLPKNFDYITWFNCGLASFAVKDSNSPGKWGYLDETGKVVIKPIYDQAYEFTENLGLVVLNNQWKFLDKTGKVVIELPPECHAANCFMDGLASVVMGHDPLNPSGWPGEDNLQGFIDKSGKMVIKPQFAGKYRNPGFSYGLAAVVQDDPRHLEGYIDKSGKFVIEPQFKRATPFTADGTAGVTYGLVKFDKTVWRFGDKYSAFLALLVSPGLINLTRAQVTDLLGKADSEDGEFHEYILSSGHGGTSAFTIHFQNDKVDKFRMNYTEGNTWYDATHSPKFDY